MNNEECNDESNKRGDPLTEEFISTLSSSKKVTIKKKMLEQLLSYINANPDYLSNESTVQKCYALFPKFLTLLNENNNNFISVEISLLTQMSNHLNKDGKFNNFLKSTLPKLFDKFNLQNTKINNELIELFNTFIKNNLHFKDFIPYIENVSVDDDDNYKSNILKFLFEQVRNDDKLNMKTMPQNVIDLLKKLSNDEDEDVSTFAFNSLETLNIRETNIDNKEPPVEESKPKEEEQKKEEPKVDDNKESNEEEENYVVTKKPKKPIQEEEENFVVEKKKSEEEKKEEEEKTPVKKNIKGKNRTFRAFKNRGGTAKTSEKKEQKPLKTPEKEEPKENDIEGKEEPKQLNYDDTPIKPSKAAVTNIRSNSKDEELKEIEKVDNTDTKNYMTYDDRPIGGKSAHKNKFQDEIEKINKEEENEIKKPIDNYDEMPIGGRKKNEPISDSIIEPNDRPIKPKTITSEYDERPIGGKNQDIQPEEEVVLQKPKIDPNSYDERPIGGSKKLQIEEDKQPINDYDDRPICGKKPQENELPKEEEKPVINEYDERPICGKKPSPEIDTEELNKEEELPKETPKKRKFNLKRSSFKKDKRVPPPMDVDNIALPKPKIDLNQNSISQPNITDEDPILNTNDGDNQMKGIDEFQRKVEEELKREQAKKAMEPSSQPEKSKTPTKKEDPKYDEIKALLGPEITQNLDETKWELKKQGFEDVNKYVQNTPKGQYKVDDLLAYLRFKLKDFKETNFNLIREAVNIFITLSQMKLLSNDNCLLILNAYYEKVTDIKLKEQINTLLTSIIDIIGPDVVARTIIGKLTKKNNAKILIEYSVIFGKLVEENDVSDLPIKEMVDICKIMAANSNPQVRTAATSLLCVLYKWNGNDIKIMIKDIKESTLKIIEAELEKVTVIEKKDQKPKKEKKGNEEKAKPKNNELIPRSDISKKITPAMMKDIKDGKWPEKKAACEAIEKIIENANMKILPNGLNDLFALIKTKLNDGNKNIVRMSVSLVSKLIESLGSGFKPFSKNIALALLPNLADKMQILRDECQSCLDKWVTFLGFDTIIYYIPNFLKTDNFDMRTEIFTFLNKNKDKFTKSIGETFFKELVSPLMICIQDRTSSVRASSEDIIIFSQQFISINLYYKALKDFKPIIANGLRQTLDKLKQEDDSASTNAPSQITSTAELKEENSRSPVSDEKRTGSSIKVFKKNRHQMSNDDIRKITKSKETSKEKVNNKSKEKTPNKSKDKTPNKSKDKTTANHLNSNSTVLKSNTKNTNSSQLKKYQTNNTSRSTVFIQNINVKPNKEKRAENDRKFKFSLDTLSSDYAKKLRDQLKSLFTEDFIKKIFSDEFKNVIDAINNLKSFLDKKEYINIIQDNLDLVFKVIGVKYISNQNPSMLKALFEFLEALIQVLTSSSYTLNETEVNIIIPLLVDKLSITNSVLKEHLVFILNNFISFIGANKSTLLMLNTSLTRNQKIKSEILDLTTDLYLNDEIDIVTKQYARVFSKFISVNDNNVKAKTIALFKEIYAKIGDELWSYIDLNEKDREFLESYLYEYEEEQEDNEEEEEEENSKEKYVNSFNTNKEEQSVHKITVQQHQRSNNNDSSINTSGSLKNKNELIKILRNLLTEDPTERVNTIIIIHELLCPKFEENKSILIANIDIIIKTFIDAMQSLFSTQNISTIPIKFAKYLATVLCKIASNEELISNISYEILFQLSEELLSNLLIENLDKIGNSQEGSIIFKSLNSTMLRILENCNSTYVILSLLELIRKYRCNEEKNKLAGLSIKCLLKVNQNLEAIISNIEVDRILLQIHLLLIDIEKTSGDLHPKNQTDQVLIKYIKNLINEIVKIKKNKIIEDYNKGVKSNSVPDKYIAVWIKNCLSILQMENNKKK